MRAPDPINTGEQQALLLRILREHGGLTRRQLAEISGYSISLVRQLTEALALHGLIIADRIAPDVPGRPSQRWSLAGDACLAVGLDVSSRALRVVILDTTGETLYQHHLPRRESVTPDDLLEDLVTVVSSALATLGERRTLVRGLGVAFGGFVDFKRGVSLDAIDIPHATLLPLQQLLAARLHIPVILDDRSRAMALAEARYGAARDGRDCICVNISSGIGTGIIIDGALYRGALGLAGELGHIPVMIGGAPCRCGGQGCLETIASSAAIEARARDLLRQGTPTLLQTLSGDGIQVSVARVAEAAQAGDAVARSLLEYAGGWLGLGLATLVNLYSCERIILTGSAMRGNPVLLEVIQREIQRYIIRAIREHIQVLPSELDEAASAIGAATFILDAEFGHGFEARLAHLQALTLE
jgi:predicted NBD/HSP70 family sugar kinase